jgi:hypothetical protein
MKKSFKLISIIALAASALLSSCKDDEVTPKVAAFKVYTDVYVGAQNATTSGSYYSSADNSVKFSKDSASFGSTVDFSFAQTGGTAPGTAKFISLNERKNQGLSKVVGNTTNTYFKLSSITADQFDTLTYNAAAVSGINLSSGNAIEVSKGNVYEFHNTTSGKKGLVKISNIVTGTNFDGVVQFNVKVLK